MCRIQEKFLFGISNIFANASWGRVIGLALQENIDVFQAEFPGYGIAAFLASTIVGTYRKIVGGRIPISSIVQHNVEWDRLGAFGVESAQIKKWEVRSLELVDEVIAVSEDDKALMVEAGIETKKITVIPHGVDCSIFDHSHSSPISLLDLLDKEEQNKKDISNAKIFFFHGTLHYWPNTQAVQFISTKLIPELEARFEGAFYFVVVGMNPPLYFAHPRIIFTGAVEDLATYIQMADVCVCPLFSGGGTRLKLLEYMAAGKAIVSTKKGAEGIPHKGLIAEIDERIFTHDELAREMTKQIVQSLKENTKTKQIRQFAQKYDWMCVTEAYHLLYRGLHRGRNWYDILQMQSTKKIQYTDILDHFPSDMSLKKSKPRTMLFLINEGCNLRCSFCDLWSHFENIPLEKVEPIFEDAKRIGTQTVVLTGGEPLLHPNWFEIVQLAQRYGFHVNMTTNGTLVEKYWEKIVESSIDSLSFSIDGLEETHDKIRGQKGAFSKTFKALKRVIEESNIDTSVYFVATNENVGELISVFELVHKVGSRFDFWPVNDVEELYIRSPKDQQLWKEAVKYISKKEASVKNLLPFYEEGLRYHNHELKGKSLRCLGFVDQYGITYDGSFLPCCVWGGQNLVVGNIFVEGLEKLWYSATVQDFRIKLYNSGCDAGCYNHSLYEFLEATGESFIVSNKKDVLNKNDVSDVLKRS